VLKVVHSDLAVVLNYVHLVAGFICFFFNRFYSCERSEREKERERESSCLTAHQHKIGYLVPL